MKPLLLLSHVQKRYTSHGLSVPVLHDLNLTIDPGEFVTISGSSGSGKTTMMNLLGCLDTPDSGTYLLDGADVSALSEKELSHIRNEKIGFVFQGFHLISCLTALENVELPLRYRGISREKRHKLAQNALERVGLSARMHHLPAELSGGQQQRVAIARAVAGAPPLILADEPTGNLDSASGAEVMKLLTELWKNGATLILITHDPAVAAAAPRQIRISDGAVISDLRL
ncbi:ABC transporter ATP-binding protein [Phocea massiliensis]|uniref:ABC transporter ATP-binding protein n=1 Tax=Merdimmobilis hominis TaxID=2897707 RepID=A0A939BDT6_9FIRM|nr:ABC transporter ATP-binding protein [Merdimmobilis hominis]MBM6920186.1 ABC transporter ATP-binding protein [Merdimmobilis hominis]